MRLLALGIARQQRRARIETTPAGSTSLRSKSIARQQWRARIETSGRLWRNQNRSASPASNGGRGLKRGMVPFINYRHAASPASNGGRGLKLVPVVGVDRVRGIARQQWRARIETPGMIAFQPHASRIARQQWRARIETATCAQRPQSLGSIARQQWRARIETANQSGRPSKRFCIARQQWRARIETAMFVPLSRRVSASPASNGGRGLKRYHPACLTIQR